MMKAVLCLALVCCFVAGALSAGCECEGMKNCFCLPATKEVKKMRVKDDGEDSTVNGLGNGKIFKVKEMESFKGKTKFRYVYVSDNCEKNIKKGERYIFMGKKSNKKYNGKKLMEVHAANGYIKVKDNLEDYQMQTLRQYRDDPKNACE